MNNRSSLSRRSAVFGSLATVLMLATACGGSSEDGGSGSSGSGGTTKISFALDWTPNTNHTGLYVAQQKGYFKDAGLDVTILPYNSASPDTLVSAGSADFGISFQDSFTVSKAAGANITSVLAVLQHWATEVAVKADRDDITSPADLDGKTYGGFGAASEEPVMKKIIQNAGGKGDFKSVVLGTSAYEAMYSGKVDFTVPFVAWEGIEAEHAKEPLKTFKYTDFGFPDAYNVLVMGNDDWLKENPEAAKKFVTALQKGYQFAADSPDQAAQDLIDANPGAFTDTSLVTESQALLAKSYLKDADGTVGTQDAKTWEGFSNFLYEAGVLADADGKKLTTAPDYSTWWTDQYLATS
ncbi:ABC transporter substrate-binding protein [Kineosporia sp. NBRC 101731]|uniref:ABC transporter substrate-binding protein n=1 Tax=Kineosporia sp. NBRC 101731 TaxID=3032199 RepID=UPI0024A52D55|nr:ABC transporter substrate-binding protein [Kineosporia sp. NBRC 101731]GLY30972.1 myristoyl transferase [Kineosporia sp. NBRC 101731]